MKLLRVPKHLQWVIYTFRLCRAMRANAAKTPSLDAWDSHSGFVFCIFVVQFHRVSRKLVFLDDISNSVSNEVEDDKNKACFSNHSQWPPESFRLRRAWELMRFKLLPWMSETPMLVLPILPNLVQFYGFLESSLFLLNDISNNGKI